MAENLTIPVFDPATYFTGTLSAYGVFVDRFGSVRRQFHVTVEGRERIRDFNLMRPLSMMMVKRRCAGGTLLK